MLAQLSSKTYKCCEAIAMTDIADFESCVMICKVEVGEALELLDNAAVQPEEGGKRQKFRACRDGTEGWVTVVGGKGTHYLKRVTRHYVCLQAAPVHAGIGADSAVVVC